MTNKAATTLALSPHQLQEVLQILDLHAPGIEVRAFGSRVTGAAKAYSDLDLALMTDQPLSLMQEALLNEAFDESTLPFKVDVLDWAATAPSFQDIIIKDGVIIRPAPGCARQDDQSPQTGNAGS